MSRPVSGAEGDLWVFGYGSLMWRPGFDYEERSLARLNGVHRALCIYSHVHRGTPAQPGLVLGLDRGGSCRGVAFRVAAERSQATIEYLREREQVTKVYRESHVTIHLQDGRAVRALVYLVDRGHAQYAGQLSPEEILRLVRQGQGVSGANPDYVLATQAHLVELGIRDRGLGWLAEHLSASTRENPVRDAASSQA